MAKIQYNLGKGMFGIEGTCYGNPCFPVEQLSTPITPKENCKRRYAGQETKWITDGGFDIVTITPDCNPDVTASDYEGGFDAFGVEWVALENGLPAMVPPGKPVLKDIADWKSLNFPYVDAWDWEANGKRYLGKIGADRWVRGGVIRLL